MKKSASDARCFSSARTSCRSFLIRILFVLLFTTSYYPMGVNSLLSPTATFHLSPPTSDKATALLLSMKSADRRLSRASTMTSTGSGFISSLGSSVASPKPVPPKLPVPARRVDAGSSSWGGDFFDADLLEQGGESQQQQSPADGKQQEFSKQSLKYEYEPLLSSSLLSMNAGRLLSFLKRSTTGLENYLLGGCCSQVPASSYCSSVSAGGCKKQARNCFKFSPRGLCNKRKGSGSGSLSPASREPSSSDNEPYKYPAYFESPSKQNEVEGTETNYGIPIDSQTEVPIDVYESMMVLGNKAVDRGAHKVRIDGAGKLVLKRSG